MIRILRGYYRLSLCGLILCLTGALILLTSWMPFKIRGASPAAWVVSLVARSLLLILNFRLDCPDPEAIRRHAGFIFANHITFADILVLLAYTQVRYVAKAEVQEMFVIGYAGAAIGCVFVKREDKESRRQARAQLAQIDHFPPVALFPEGKRGPGDQLLPFRHGAFDIAVQGQVPILPCAIAYQPQDVAIWHRGENIVKRIWTICSHDRPILARIVPLATIVPAPDDDPVQLSVRVHADLEQAIGQAKSALMAT